MDKQPVKRGIPIPHLEAWRMRKGLTQRELARLSTVSQKTITFLETQRQVARFGTVAKLATALGLEREQLLNDAPRPTRKKKVEEAQG